MGALLRWGKGRERGGREGKGREKENNLVPSPDRSASASGACRVDDRALKCRAVTVFQNRWMNQPPSHTTHTHTTPSHTLPTMPNFPLYHCPCHPLLPPYLPSSLPALHPLDALYFCDACDAIRCARCVQLEVASYFCPGCLFEVPSASVRAERNRSVSLLPPHGPVRMLIIWIPSARCARNCFQCPACPAALHVVPSDPPRPPPPDSSSSSSGGQAPYYLECRACGWNSSSIDLSFDKPVGLARESPPPISARFPCFPPLTDRRNGKTKS